MRTTSIRAARRDASSICSKTECNIVNMSSPDEVKRLSEAQLMRQIKMSQKLYQKHRDRFNRIRAASKRTRLEPGITHPIKLKMSLMEDSQRRFEKQLRLFKAKAGARSAAKSAPRKRTVVQARGRTVRAPAAREARLNP